MVPQPRPGHLVQFYETDRFLARAAGEFLAAGLRDGEPLVIIATEPHRRAILGELASRGFDLQQAGEMGRLLLLDAWQTLDQLMVGGSPSGERFEQVVGGALQRASAGSTRRVRAFGEMVDLLWRGGQRQAALRLEEMWNGLARERDFSLLCAYTMANFYKEDGLPGVCAQHDRVLEVEDGGGSGAAEHARALAAEIAHRREVEETLRASVAELRLAREELSDFAESAVIGLQWVDGAGKVLWANQEQLEMMGCPRDEYVGQPWSRFVVEPPAFADLIARLVQEGSLRDGELRLRAGDGTVKDVLVSANAYRRDGQVAYYRCFVRDVTDRKRAESERARLVAELQRTVHFNELFTAILGHDLRNPLNAMMTSAELALRRTGDEVVTRPLQRVLSSGKRMAAMIGQLLDFTRARQGGLPLERQVVDLHAVAEEVRAEVEAAHPGRQIQVRAEGDLRGRWDRARLAQALSNLISNAVQHGQPDAPVVVSLDGGSPHSVRAEVQNQGVIPPELLPEIFKPFRGAEQPRSGASPGLGLGLYITEQVVRAHRGDIAVASSVGAGTLFTVWLPRGGEGGAAFTARAAPAPASQPAPAPPAAELGLGSEAQVRLLVDSIHDYAIFMLDTQGHVRSWNVGAEHVLGYQREEILGKHLSVFYRPEES
ncbi:MAG TPA: MEDS domain-containing protein, partial [Myxococcales bacterium]|nr:MEDS domain-containing protein [Myxococcales bacterium]